MRTLRGGYAAVFAGKQPTFMTGVCILAGQG